MFFIRRQIWCSFGKNNLQYIDMLLAIYNYEIYWFFPKNWSKLDTIC